MSRILITGAAGFIGSRLISTLRAGHELFGLVRPKPEGERPVGVNWLEHDLSQPLDQARLPDRLDAIIHLAQSRHYREFPEQARDIFDVNIESTFHLLEYARKAGVRCFIFASSGGVYGYSYERFVETDPVNPLNFYLSSKYTSELLIANYQSFFRTVVFRFFFVYGAGQREMLIPNLVQKVINGERIVIEGDPGLRINPIYIEDAIRAFKPALQLPASALFNVAGDQIVTITELVRLIETVSGKPALIQHQGPNPVGDLVGDNSRLKKVLGVYPCTPLLQGLKQML
jgi:nucleoside-diphosphate-sugar epimerase